MPTVEVIALNYLIVFTNYKKDKDVNEEDDGYEDENVPFLLRAEAHLRLPNYYS